MHAFSFTIAPALHPGRSTRSHLRSTAATHDIKASPVTVRGRATGASERRGAVDSATVRWHGGGRRLRATQIAITLLLVIVVVSVVKRFVIDLPHLGAGTQPTEQFDRRYVAHPWLAYLHIVPGAVYLLLAPLQLAYRFRRRHYPTHRRLGRLLVALGLLSGTFALIFGGLFSFGGRPEAAAAMVFGLWFVVCLVRALRAIQRGDIVRHRRWMIRAFAVSVGIGTVRIWLGLLQASGLVEFAASFGPAFWLAFSLHVGSGELWLRAFPRPPEDTAGSAVAALPARTTPTTAANDSDQLGADHHRV
ncbi:MAG: DUF2306 domain-containing protein [Nakamurella sp.]